MPTFYVDETGFTGEDLLATDQPMFVNATNDFSDEEARGIVEDIFKGVQLKELKYRQLSRRPNHQERVVQLIKLFAADPKRVGTWVAHKEFGLVTLIEWWLEPLAHRSGLNLYKDGANLATANMLFICLEGFWSNSFRRNLLTHFQRMFRSRTEERFDDCRKFIEKAKKKANERQADTLRYLWPSFELLGLDHVTHCPDKVLDLALPGLVFLGHKWRERHEGPWEVVHDQSSNMAKQKWLWDALSSPDIAQAQFPGPDGPSTFPMNISTTRFGNSESELQLQLCDVLAGATSEWLSAVAVGNDNDPYHTKLRDAGIESLVVGNIWPSKDITPEELGRRGWDGNRAIEFLTKELQTGEKQHLN